MDEADGGEMVMAVASRGSIEKWRRRGWALLVEVAGRMSSNQKNTSK
jgi:hypothetical protein